MIKPHTHDRRSFLETLPSIWVRKSILCVSHAVVDLLDIAGGAMPAIAVVLLHGASKYKGASSHRQK